MLNLIPYEQFINETISHEKGKYIVRSKSKHKKLGTHRTKKEALKQLAAIEISKAKRGK